MHWKTLLILMGALCIYNIIGGVVFHFLEQPNETNTMSTETDRFTSFVNTYTCVNSTVMKTFVLAVIKAYDNGVLSVGNTSSATNWDLASCFFFSFTVLSTIGYGHIAPATTGGQIFCIIFALIGIPAFGVTMVNIGQKLNNIYCKLERARKCFSNPKVDRVVKYIVFHVLFYCLLVLLPAVLFTLVEGWTYGSSIYYAFVSLTTIGFGDFVAGTTEVNLRILYRLIIILWLVLGLSWVAFMISTMQDILLEFTGKMNEKNDEEKKAAEEKNADKNGDAKEKNGGAGSPGSGRSRSASATVCELSVCSSPAGTPEPLHY